MMEQTIVFYLNVLDILVDSQGDLSLVLLVLIFKKACIEWWSKMVLPGAALLEIHIFSAAIFIRG